MKPKLWLLTIFSSLLITPLPTLLPHPLTAHAQTARTENRPEIRPEIRPDAGVDTGTERLQ